jgi:hypothetical protein
MPPLVSGEGSKNLWCFLPLIDRSRACPGRGMAENGLFIAVASILHVFNIVLPRGAPPPDSNAFIPGTFS